MSTDAVAEIADPLVSIIIVTYGTGSIVLDALDAIRQFTRVEHEVIVVDSPPPDPARRTSELLGDRNDIRLIEATENLGFAGGNEYGVSHARGTFLCFLNPDVVVGTGWLEPLVAALGDPVVGIAAPVLLNPDGSLQEAGQLIFDNTFTAPIGGFDVMPADRTNVFSRDVDYASAACWVVRRAEHIERGGFDRHYHPAYFEDADYALRVEAGGQRTRLVAEVPVVHHWGQGTSSRAADIGQVTHARFRKRWEHDLSVRPGPPSTRIEAIESRDRLAQVSTLIVAWSDDCDEVQWSTALDAAVRRSVDDPRVRITLLTDRTPDAEQDRAARVAGLEIEVVDDPARRLEVEAERSTIVDLVEHVGDVPHRRRFTWWAIGIMAFVFIAGVAIRWVLLGTPAASLNSDEAYTGIESYEILHGRFPIVLGGTVYTLPFEGYLYAPFASLFASASVVALKLSSTVSWFLASIAAGAIGTRLANRRAGMIAAGLCWIAPGPLMVLSITAYSAYASGMLVASLGFLVAVIIVDSTHPPRRLLLLFGVLAGFGFWLHPMFVAVMAPMTGYVLWTVRRRLDAWVSVIVGGIVGCAPLLLWNALNAFPSLESPVAVPGSYTDRLRTFAVDLFPRAFGLRSYDLEWYHDLLGPLLYVALLAVFATGAWSIGRSSRQRSHVLLLVVLVAVLPIMALLQNLIFANDGRYAMISFPFLVVVLGVGIDHLAGRRPPIRAAVVIVLVSTLWIFGYVRSSIQPFVDARGVDPNAQLDQIVDVLDQAGVERIYGSYWAVLPVEFMADDRIVGGVFPFWPVRFPERQRIVGATSPEDVAIIYMAYDEDPAYLLMPVENYERIPIGDRVIYLPLTHSSGLPVDG